jgi:hypothetical protein
VRSVGWSAAPTKLLPETRGRPKKGEAGWPEGAKEEVVKALREIEEDFIIGPATRHELDRSHQEALRGEGVSLEDIKERLGM